MSKKLRILYLASEVAPFAKTGGLADVSYALPKTLLEMGHDVRVIMPKYGNISERKYVLRDVIRLKEIKVKLGETEHQACAKSAFLPDSKVQVYFLVCDDLFGRKELYVDPKTGTDFADNAERFAFFSKSVLEIIKLLHWQPQIIHCNDWQTGLVPYYLKNEYSNDPFFKDIKTLMSIHNMAYQGVFPKAKLNDLGLEAELDKTDSVLKKDGSINYMKSGLLTADALTAVSPTYAQEIQTIEELGAGLQDVAKSRNEDLYGILNGVDYGEWNPETDAEIEEKYTVDDFSAKSVNKKALLEKAGLEYSSDTPVIGIVSRLAEQKGFDLITKAAKDIVDMGAQLIVLGTGDPKIEKELEALTKKYPKNIGAFIAFDNSLAHLIEAGSDMFLMPSRYEPCGLNQLYSLKYGTIPIVRKTGGLADTVIDSDKDSENGNGFVFDKYDVKAMTAAIKKAVTAFKDKDRWNALIQFAMKQDFSWTVSASQYVEIYSKLTSNKK